MTTRDTANRLLITRVMKDKLSEADRDLRDRALADFDQPGVRDIGVIAGEQIGSVQLIKGRQAWRVVDNDALLAWVKANHPDEVVTVENVRGSYIQAILARAKADGGAFDPETGDSIPGVDVVHGEPTLNVKPSEDAADVIGRALAEGRLTWEDVATAAIEVVTP